MSDLNLYSQHNIISWSSLQSFDGIHIKQINSSTFIDEYLWEISQCKVIDWGIPTGCLVDRAGGGLKMKKLSRCP